MSQETEWQREKNRAPHYVFVSVPNLNWLRIRRAARNPEFEWEGESESDFFLWCATQAANDFLQAYDYSSWWFDRSKPYRWVHVKLTYDDWDGITSFKIIADSFGWTGRTIEDFFLWCVHKVMDESYALQSAFDLEEDSEDAAIFDEGEDAELKDDGTIQIPSDVLNAIGTAPGTAKVRVSNGTIVIEPPTHDVKCWEENDGSSTL